jgi:hypothetical protein
LDSCAQDAVHRGGRLTLHRRRSVGGDAEGEAGVGMAEPLGDDARVRARLEPRPARKRKG